MKDQFSRNINYMRISITDRCNLRCQYCMPSDIQLLPMEDLLTYQEILDVVREAVKLGITKIKVTGGEPLVRRGAPKLIKEIKEMEGIEQVTMTSNGILLDQFIDELKDAKLDAINISLDTLHKDEYKKITGFDELEKVLANIDLAISSGFKTKVNVVLQKDLNPDWKSMVELAKDKPLDVRFIELMPIGFGKSGQRIDNYLIKEELKKMYPDLEEDDRIHGNGPAEYIYIPCFKGSIGFISAINNKFCEDCNRIRLTSTGKVKPCLCYGDTVDLRDILRSDDEDRNERLRAALQEAIEYKPKEHCFETLDEITEEKKMSQIGG